jgi:Zn-dependent peptidase ImmA (M78 family)/DNA-binding XRE family transcriptional regulator
METSFKDRLIAARKMAGLSLRELAERIGGEITRQALHKYELGESKPGSKTLIALANALSVPVDYFFSSPKEEVVLEDVDFRRYSSKLSKPMRDSISYKAQDVFERYFELENLMGIFETVAPFSFSREINSLADSEEAAIFLRKQWNLGNDPISDVVDLLEDKGFKVIEISAPVGFDGMKASYKDKKLIVLKKSESGSDIVRKRFTALHELAHHNLMFSPDLDEKKREKLCHSFASAFLFPEDMARKELDRERFHFYEKELVLIKEKWGISFSALFARATDLGIISSSTYKNFNIGYRQRHYHLPDSEPGRFMSKERPTRMEKLIFQGLAKEVLSLNEAAYFAGISGWEMREQMSMLL